MSDKTKPTLEQQLDTLGVDLKEAARVIAFSVGVQHHLPGIPAPILDESSDASQVVLVWRGWNVGVCVQVPFGVTHRRRCPPDTGNWTLFRGDTRWYRGNLRSVGDPELSKHPEFQNFTKELQQALLLSMGGES